MKLVEQKLKTPLYFRTKNQDTMKMLATGTGNMSSRTGVSTNYDTVI